MTTRFLSFFTLIFSFALLNAQQKEKKKKYSQDFELEVNAEYRYFYDSPQFTGQESNFPSISLQPSYSLSWQKGYQKLVVSPFVQLDRDKNRTYFDIRELYYQKAKNNWELNVGLKKVFWGVTESNHLVDIINQSDALKSFDGEQKLGQPMLQFSWMTSRLGTFDFFYLPYHRKRSFPGDKGRLRFQNTIDANALGYESKNNEWNPDISLRWKHYIGAFDIGLSYFKGNGREPFFELDAQGNFLLFYPLIDQYGVDLQLTLGAFLFKLESIYRTASQQDFFAAVTGFEYTFSNIDGNGLDIGILGEYLYDERGQFAFSGFQNDIFYGSRIAFNDSRDTAILFGGIVDLDTNTKLFSVEASRRFAKNTTLNLELRMFNNVAETEPLLGFFRQDSFVNLSFFKYF